MNYEDQATELPNVDSVSAASSQCLSVSTSDLSKSAAKKAQKRAAWQAGKQERRAREKEKKRAKKLAQKEAKCGKNEAVYSTCKENNSQEIKRAFTHKPQRSLFRATVVVDLGFDELMTEKEITSLAQQLSYLYSSNRSSHAPFARIIVTGPPKRDTLSSNFDPPSHPSAIREGYTRALDEATEKGNSLSIFEGRIGKHIESKSGGHWRRWRNVELIENGGLNALWEHQVEDIPDPQGMQNSHPNVSPPQKLDDQDEIVENTVPNEIKAKNRFSGISLDKDDVYYLTADTDSSAEVLEEGKTYVIGGIVDRNRHKNICARKASSCSIRTLRLPIDPDHLSSKATAGQHLNSRKVLTVNQVFDILLGWTETRNWEEALVRGLPNRKFATKDDEKSESQRGTKRSADGRSISGTAPPENITTNEKSRYHKENELDIDEDELYNSPNPNTAN